MITSEGARRWRAVVLCASAVAACGPALSVTAETITLSDAPATVSPGASFSFLIKITGDTPLVGYSLELLISPDAGTEGTMTGDPVASNFFLSENLIERDGGGLHPTYSMIDFLDGGPGLAITGLDQTFTATAIPGPGHDVLAEVFIDVSGDAYGMFTIELGENTVLNTVIDGLPVEVDFESSPATVFVPEPGCLGILGGLCLLFARRRPSGRAGYPR